MSGRVARRAAIAVAGAAIATATAAMAATLAVGGGGTGAGAGPVVPCDTAFSTTVGTTAGIVTSVTVGGIADPACEGGEVHVTLRGAAGTLASGGPVTVPADGDVADGSVVVPLTGGPAPDGVTAARILVVGP